MKSLYVIDNSNWCYKFKSVHKYAKKIISGVSVDISVLVGYLRSFKQMMQSDIMIVLDGIPKMSLELLPSYKGQRLKEHDDECGVPKHELIQFLTQIGTIYNKNISVVCSPGQEADQVISSIVHVITNNLPKKYKLISSLNRIPLSEDPYLSFLKNPVLSEVDLSEYDSVIIATTDSDMRALQRYHNVFIDTSTSGKCINDSLTADAVHYVNPAAICIYKAIYGDISDNVPKYDISTDFIKLIDRSVKSDEDVQKFISNVETRTFDCSYGSLLRLLDKIDRFKLFKTNIQVVNLEFYSMPLKVSYNNYDIKSTIEKYSLRV